MCCTITSTAGETGSCCRETVVRGKDGRLVSQPVSDAEHGQTILLKSNLKYPFPMD